MGEIIERARKFRDEVKSRRAVSISASQLWDTSHEEMHIPAIDETDSETEFVAFLTECNAFTFPRLVGDPEHGKIVENYLRFLDRNGSPLSKLPPHICESRMISEKTLSEMDGRPISTMFLLHLCVALRIQRHVPRRERVLEIGGGYGNLARIMRLFDPQQHYVIVDLLESLYCSYVFISAHFPQARTLFVTAPADLEAIDSYDFVFIPTEFFGGLAGRSFDLVVNTCSLGEMPQATVDRYMRFINEEATVRHFYSINRFGPFSAEWVMPDQANVSVKLDPNWRIAAWDAFGETGFSQIEPVAPAYLELLAAREIGDDKAHEAQSAVLAAAANAYPPNSSAWHYHYWNAIRLWPNRPTIREYLKIIEPLIFRDSAYYRELYVQARPHAPAVVDGVHLSPPETVGQVPANAHANAPTAAASASDSERDELRAQISAIYASRSWRLTRPLRMVMGWLQARS